MLEKTFSPKDVEGRIYAQWEASGAFRAARRPGAEAFSIVIPPPNVTGRLHIGHALNNTLQDILARFERMRGKDVLWQPGTDHAGIATQLIVERQLAERQMSRVGLGREKFLEEVWKWKAESGGAIIEQQRRLGASADWSRERFTMDEGLSKAVTKTFVELYRQGLIYKDKRLVNWDTRLQTAVSDLEVENIEIKGNLWHIRYPIADSDQFIVVATTRPETMLGDTAVAVHPDDARYQALIGKQVVLPLTRRKIPILADEYSDPEKGTGAVKITPGHDFNDFEVGKRHKLELINILNKDGTLNDSVPASYHGLSAAAARKKVVADLEAAGLLEKIEPITHAVPHDEKTKTVVLEPFLTEQWYLNVEPLAAKAVTAVEKGETQFFPENWANIYFGWLKNIRPWCISRQLWWGHQIPVWYGPKLDAEGYYDLDLSEAQAVIESKNTIPIGPTIQLFVAETEAEALQKAEWTYKRANLRAGTSVSVAQSEDEGAEALRTYNAGKSNKVKIWRDPDVLDTWFSSALWPFSTMGWPEETPELARFYPTSVLVTGFDIIFFWVARMMMMGIHFLGEVPFRHVVIHNRVLDEQGAKMSKTKGNVVDPLTLIDEFGADALRFTLALAAGQSRDMRIGPSRVETSRNFATKLWNAARFCEMNNCIAQPDFDPAKVGQTVNKWIVAETATAVAEVTRALEAPYRFNEAAGAVYRFVYDVFCDWYLEFAKPLFNGTDEGAKAETRATAAWVRDRLLKLLHPFMPFITEELWARTAATAHETLLIEAAWPDLSKLPAGSEAAAEMQWVISLIQGIRSVRAEMNVPAGAKIPMVLTGADATAADRLSRNRGVIETLARLSSSGMMAEIPKGSAQFVLGEAVVALPLGDVIDFAKERVRLEKDLKKAREEIVRFDAKLGNEQFVAKAPEEVLEEQRSKRAEASALVARLEEAIGRLST
ncbi:MAG: valine--tRNA ligase [Alphaproteobacteria bacterium]|nr:valine--tRNA ligase [Alphaproteobacteria bacterium]